MKKVIEIPRIRDRKPLKLVGSDTITGLSNYAKNSGAITFLNADNYSFTDKYNIDYRHVYFFKNSMRACDLEGISADNGGFEDCDLTKANFYSSSFKDSFFRNCELMETTFDKSVFENADFSICNFISTTFDNGILDRVTFRNCNFKNVDFSSSRKHKINFTNCHFIHCDFSKGVMPYTVKFFNCQGDINASKIRKQRYNAKRNVAREVERGEEKYV